MSCSGKAQAGVLAGMPVRVWAASESSSSSLAMPKSSSFEQRLEFFPIRHDDLVPGPLMDPP
jgi:hypothetical protein